MIFLRLPLKEDRFPSFKDVYGKEIFQLFRPSLSPETEKDQGIGTLQLGKQQKVLRSWNSRNVGRT